MADHEEPPCASPASDLLRFLSRSERLEAFPRTGWQVCGVQNPESVAAHSFGVALVALWISDHIDEDVNTEKVLRIALIHDLPEAMLTDLPRPVKTLLGAKACREAEEKAASLLFSSHPPGWLESFREYQRAETLEARIVKASDRIQMLAKALQYQFQHRGDTTRFFDAPETWNDFGIPLVASIYDELKAHFQDQRWHPFNLD